jgi:hypothetical protein
VSTEEATTSLTGVISSLLKPSSEAEKILSRLGVPFGATALRANGLVGTLEKLTVVSEKYPDKLAEAIPNIRGLTAASALQKEELARIREIVASMNTDQLSPAFAKQMETFSRSTSVLRGQLTATAIAIGAELAPVFLGFAKIVKKGLTIFNGFSSGTKKWIAIMIGIVAVLAPVIIGIGILVGLLAPAVALIGGITVTMVGWVAAIGAAIAAVVALGVAVFQNFDKIKGAFNKVKNFFGFGGDQESLDVTGAADIVNTSQAEVNVNLNAPKGVVDNVKTVTTGNTSGLNLGVNMVEQS